MSSETDTFSVGKTTETVDAPAAGLVTVYAPERGLASVLFLSADRLVIGREPPSELVVPFGSVSRSHARITRCSGGWLVEDLGSHNGTFINGSRIVQATLSDGDELRIGAVVFKLVERDANRFVSPDVPVPACVGALVGGASMGALRAEILRVAASSPDLSVLILGESGTGKEVVARTIHDASGRTGAFAAVNCAAVPASLLEAELFGARRGAFTGLERDRLGIVRSADGGTLFLDEIGDMPLEAQAKLLRVLDTKKVTPLGSHVSEPVDVRVVSATHRPIGQLVQQERFRADLYARISAHIIDLLPLRERKEDIQPLVRHVLARLGSPQTTSQFMIGLLRYHWPLNVRELEAAVRRAVMLAGGGPLDEQHLPPAVLEAIRAARAKDEAASLPGERANAPTANELQMLLRKYAGNVAGVARELGKDRAQIHRWLRLHQIALAEFRPSAVAKPVRRP